MASLRRQILEALAARFDALAGWQAFVRDDVDAVTLSAGNTKAVYLYDRGESGRTDTHLYYDQEMDILALVRVAGEDAPVPGEVFAYLDSALVELQQAIHADPINLGVAGVQMVLQQSSTPQPPDEGNLYSAEWRLRVDYRHDFQDPEAWTGTF